MNRLDYFLMMLKVACMGLAVATFATLPSTAPDFPSPSFLRGLRTSTGLQLVWFSAAIGVHAAGLCDMLGPRDHYSNIMVAGHWAFSAISLGTASDAWAVITEEHFRYACNGSSWAICVRYELCAGLAMLLGLLSVMVCMVMNVARLNHGPVLPVPGQGQVQMQGQGQGQH